MTLPLTKQWLIDTVLSGVDLTFDNGDPFPDSMFYRQIEMGIARVETDLDIPLEETTLVERHDWTAEAWREYSFLRTHRRPVISVDELLIMYADQTVATIPGRWFVQQFPTIGQFQLMPISSLTAQSAVGMVLPWAGPVMGAGSHSVPGYFRITYKAGFRSWNVLRQPAGAYSFPASDRPTGIVAFGLTATHSAAVTFSIVGTASDGSLDGTVTIPAGSRGPVMSDFRWQSIESVTASAMGAATWYMRASAIPSDVQHLIALRAASTPLNVAGDLVAGAAIASKSVSMDGLSQSIGTTASATNAGYGSRLIQLEKEAGPLTKALRRKYHGVGMVA